MIRSVFTKSLRPAATLAVRSYTTQSALRLASRLQPQLQYTRNIIYRPSINLIQQTRSYSAGPEPLTKEFALERIIGLLESYDKVCL